MKQIIIFSGLLFAFNIYACDSTQEDKVKNPDLDLVSVSVTHNSQIAATIWEMNVLGDAGKSTPTPNGALDGAPVLGYVFPTTLKPEDVGFGASDGILALALTSHPDFDDTPLWDENVDKNYANDGVIWHPHWVVLVSDERVKGGLAVKQFNPDTDDVMLPPTNPGMPMYMDSPGFQVITNGSSIKVVVPDYRISNKTSFEFDGVTVFMEVNTEDNDLPMLGVYDIYSVASGDLSLPYSVQ